MKVEIKGETIIIDGFKFEGFEAEDYSCSSCNSNYFYYEKFDSHFCAKCNYWVDDNCGDPDCCYCSDRPDKPLPFK